MRTEQIALLTADPDLGALLSEQRRSEAERRLLVSTHRLSVGAWDVSRLAGASADHIGLLILDGVIARELIVADHVSAELLGPGDLIRPWQTAASRLRRRSTRSSRPRSSTASPSAPCDWPPRRRSRSSPGSTGG